ncbi:hypothetical protein EVAR_24144_1 [Eumeta japonica]|uniref:Uncharacterized protein n=1 Tax=Eumeta variegata TaxID=151549 RepID=A0A4C1YSM2_EUMVA|nr:hypothetical protein EVAR_24144_1 [Eumeta japonica]
MRYLVSEAVAHGAARGRPIIVEWERRKAFGGPLVRNVRKTDFAGVDGANIARRRQVDAVNHSRFIHKKDSRGTHKHNSGTINVMRRPGPRPERAHKERGSTELWPLNAINELPVRDEIGPKTERSPHICGARRSSYTNSEDPELLNFAPDFSSRAPGARLSSHRATGS